MRRLLVVGASVWVLLMLFGASVSADRWVRGKVTAVGGDSLTVMFKGKEMKFTIAKDTTVFGPGLGTAQRQAGGIKLSEAIKVGEGIEVHYVESGGTMRATDIRTDILTEGSSEDSGDSASGRVTAITASSLTIKSGSGDMTFVVDQKTRVVARGAGTATREKRAAGSGPAITDLVRTDDEVTVSYMTTGSSRRASEVRVRIQRK
jgi:hypothetical protein